ncbi:hypothetical protein K1719_002924 [Acacia pycnantha]|nr:hypothetical protein K1719_002924 [Acacia pycnantha]
MGASTRRLKPTKRSSSGSEGVSTVHLPSRKSTNTSIESLIKDLASGNNSGNGIEGQGQSDEEYSRGCMYASMLRRLGGRKAVGH